MILETVSMEMIKESKEEIYEIIQKLFRNIANVSDDYSIECFLRDIEIGFLATV